MRRSEPEALRRGGDEGDPTSDTEIHGVVLPAELLSRGWPREVDRYHPVTTLVRDRDHDDDWRGHADLADAARLGHLDAVLESCDDALYSQDADGLITGWSRGAALVLWYPAAQVIGWRSTRLYAEERWEEHEVVLRRVLAGEQQSQVETDLRRSDGQTVPALLSAAPIRDPLGRVIGASVIARDVTDRRVALGALAESEARRREVESLAQVGGWVLDLATGAVQWSEELHKLHGLDPVAFDGTLASHLALVHDDDRCRVDAALTRAVAAGEPLATEYRVVRPDRQVRWLCARAVPVVDAGGVVIGLRGVCQDVTDRRPV